MTFSNWPNEFGDPSWFIKDRFGLFIHFGLYSTAGRHEWLMTTEKIDPEHYQMYFKHFNPELLDFKSMADRAKRAGMKYAVMTTKHHEGFSLFDSKYSDFKVTNTLYKKDIIKEFVEAFTEAGIKIGFYYSLIDWHHEDFTIDGLHPQRDNGTSRQSNEFRDMTNYISFMKNQLTELLTDYGVIDYLFFDFSYGHQNYGWSKGKGKDDWESESILDHVRQLQPNILINDRLDLEVGVTTPEQYQPETALTRKGEPLLWEVCMSMKETWGYDRDAKEWKSSETLLKSLIHTVSCNGNFLLNIGPNGKGEIDPREGERLVAIEQWMRLNGKSIYGASGSLYSAPPESRYTQIDNRLYLHLFSWPLRHIHLKGLAGKVEYIQFLYDQSEIKWREYDPQEVITTTETIIEETSVLVQLPVNVPDQLIPVIEIILK